MSEIKITAGEPGCVFCHYDVSDNGLRWRVLQKLYENTMIMKSESVYYGPWSLQLYEALKQLQQLFEEMVKKSTDPKIRNSQFNIQIIPAGVPDPTLEALMDEYESKFNERFGDVQDLLSRIEDMLDEELLKEEKDANGKLTGKEVPYTGHEILLRCYHAGAEMEILRTALTRRKEWELEQGKAGKNAKEREAKKKRFDSLERKLRQMDAVLRTWKDSAQKHKDRENASAASKKEIRQK